MNDCFRQHDPALNIHNTLPVARPGLPFICGLAAALLAGVLFHWFALAAVLALALAFTVWFFRDPARPTPPGEFGLSPADGRVIKVEDVADNPFTGGPAKKVSIFMSVFNVHVNRAPISGRLLSQTYRPGAFFNASFDKASDQNERNALVIGTEAGPVAVVQIAGLVARRIVSWAREGDGLERGGRFGMIRFGSRVDLYLPPASEIMVAVGQRVSAGWSPIWR